MKIAYASDLHLEFEGLRFDNTEGAEVLVLAGDICVAAAFQRSLKEAAVFMDFFEHVAAQFPYVLYVMGNHEHYQGDFQTTAKVLREHLSHLSNVKVLDKQVFVLNEVTFIGGTLWTDMRKGDPLTIHVIKHGMNEFSCVENSAHVVNFRAIDYEGMGVTPSQYHSTRVVGQNPELDEKCKNPKYKFKTRGATFSPEDAIEDHRNFLEYIRIIVEGKDAQKFVVISHHAPSAMSVHPRYQGHSLNAGYHSDLFEFVYERPQIVAWIHGHVHDSFDYMLSDTRVVCNPRGYAGYEIRKGSPFSPAIIDV